VAGTAAAWTRATARDRREARFRVPPAVVVMGSAASGRDRVAAALAASGRMRRMHGLEFVPGLCRWFPDFNRQVGRVLEQEVNQTAGWHARRLLARLLDTGGAGVAVLEYEAGTEYEVTNVPHLLPELMPEALFVHVVRNPLTEYAELAGSPDAPTPAELAWRWVTAVREWLQVGLGSPQRYVVVARDPLVSSRDDVMVAEGDALVLGVDLKPAHAVLSWRSIVELGGSLDAVTRRFGMEAGGPTVPLSFPVTGTVAGVPEAARHRIVQIAAGEMILLRMIGRRQVRDIVPPRLPRDEPSARGVPGAVV